MPVDQHAQIADDVGQVEHGRPHRLLAREGEQLAHQHCRAVGIALDLHQIGKARIRRPRLQQQMVGGQKDRRQHVVEVMRDAAGKRADRIHLLRLRHLGFQRLLLA